MIDFDKFFGFNEKEEVTTLMSAEESERIWRESCNGTYKGPVRSWSVDANGNVYNVHLKF